MHAATDAWTQDPDPKDSPYVRTLSERRADALDDMARDSLLRSAAAGFAARPGPGRCPR